MLDFLLEERFLFWVLFHHFLHELLFFNENLGSESFDIRYFLLFQLLFISFLFELGLLVTFEAELNHRSVIAFPSLV